MKLCFKIIESITGKCNLLWRIKFFLCTCAYLIPSELLEFRYFICPIVIAMIHMNYPTWMFETKRKILYFEILAYLLLNIILCYIFIYLPVYNEKNIIRFMW